MVERTELPVYWEKTDRDERFNSYWHFSKTQFQIKFYLSGFISVRAGKRVFYWAIFFWFLHILNKEKMQMFSNNFPKSPIIWPFSELCNMAISTFDNNFDYTNEKTCKILQY